MVWKSTAASGPGWPELNERRTGRWKRTLGWLGVIVWLMAWALAGLILSAGCTLELVLYKKQDYGQFPDGLNKTSTCTTYVAGGTADTTEGPGPGGPRPPDDVQTPEEILEELIHGYESDLDAGGQAPAQP